MKHSFVTNLEESFLSRCEESAHVQTTEPLACGTKGTSYQKVDQLSLTGQAQNQSHQTTAMARVFTISKTGIQMPEHPECFNALLDSGASRSFVNSNNLVLHEVDDTTPTIWDAMSGSITTVATKRLRIIPTMIITEQPVEHTWHVASNMGAMDLIIGRDLMQSLGLQMNFASNTLIWEGATLPLVNTTVCDTGEGAPGETDQSPRRDDARDQSPTTIRGAASSPNRRTSRPKNLS